MTSSVVEGTTAPGPTRRPSGMTELPLTAGQERMWFVDRYRPGWPSHDEMVYRLRGRLDAGALVEALQRVLSRHEAVWARFADRDGVPVQIFDGPGRLGVEHVDLSGVPGPEREERLRQVVGQRRLAPFDLARGPMVRVSLIRVDPDDHVLCMVLHHIISDGTSWTVLIGQLYDEYGAVVDGRPSQPPSAPVDYGDYVLWQRARVAERRPALEYWLERLAGAAVLDLPTDRPRPAERSPDGGVVRREIDLALTERLEQFARAQRCTPYMVLLAAYQTLLARHSGQEDVCVGSPTAGRDQPEVESVVGLFINIVVLRGDLSGDPTFRDLLRRTRQRVLEALSSSRQEIPYELLLAELDVPRDTSRTPLFQTIFTMHTQEGPSTRVLPGIEADYYTAGDTYAVYDLVVDVWRATDGLSVMMRYDTNLFDAATIATLNRQFETILRHVVDDPDVRLSDLCFDDPPARAIVLARGLGPVDDAPDDRPSVPEMVAARAARQPDAVAVRLGAATVSYRELLRRADRLAARLSQRGAGPGSIVAVGLPRGFERIVALLGVWRAGAAYLPLDPSHPAAYRAGLRHDAGAVLEVTPDDVAAAAAPGDAAAPTVSTRDGLAYVVYTSGSTGVPKGVAVGHRALAARVRWMTGRYGVGPADRVLQFATVAFDTHVEEIYPCLVGGAELVLLPEGEHLPDFLAEPAASGLTILDLPTPYWHDLVSIVDTIHWPAALRLMIIGADQVEAAAVAAWRAHVAHHGLGIDGVTGEAVELVNTYGPTEATVIATAARLGPADAGRRPPIGAPIGQTTAYVLDERGRLQPDGVAGELCLGGDGLAYGYLRRPGATADRFVPDRFGPPGRRLYRTGDRARWRSDGQLEFLGRIDRQVKVRGYRVEPGEIQARLLALPGVAQAHVVAQANLLVAYVVGRPGSGPDVEPDTLRRRLAEVLPAHLVPAAFVPLDRLPLTANGKLDVAALPAARPAPAPVYVAPSGDAQTLVAGVWREVLGVDRVGATDDFFAIGGHSLLAVRVAARLGAAVGVDVPVRTLFQHRDLAGLARAVEELLVAELNELSEDEADRLYAETLGKAP